MSECVRRLQVDEIRNRAQGIVEFVAREDEREPGLRVDHGLPGPDSVELSEDHVGVRAQESRQRRIELLAGAIPRELLGRLDAPDAVRDLGELRQLREP